MSDNNNNNNKSNDPFAVPPDVIKELLKQAMRDAGYKTYIDTDGTERSLNEENA